MKKIIGVSSFGLNDCVSLPSFECKEAGFYLADAVLPVNPLGYIRTGQEAEEERTHSGVFWPPDARLEPEEPLRRVPIPCAWRALVEAADRVARWNIGRGVSFPIQKIIACHIHNILKFSLSDLGGEHQSLDQYDPVIAIPDNLDEYGQELLLRECGALGIRDAMLIWRPIAVALAWLEKVKSDLPDNLNNDDHIHVIYMGPDAVEFTTCRLRIRTFNDRLYYLPLRDRPLELPKISGLDWAANLIEMAYKKVDHGAFWQALTNFPEIWQAIGAIDWDKEKLPRAWCLHKKWSLWDPSPDLHKHVYDVLAGYSSTLQEIINKSLKLNSKPEPSNETIAKAIDSTTRHMSRILPKGRLLGMIICGPLAPQRLPNCIEANLDKFCERGLIINDDMSVPAYSRLWLCNNCDNAVAEGASIYGARILSNEPTYLDTLPQLSLLTVKDGSLEWVDIVEDSECEGGETYRRKIEGSFFLKENSNKLDVYLRKGSPHKSSSSESIPDFGLPEEWRLIIQKNVLRLGSVEAVLNYRGLDGHENAKKYALTFAELKFKTIEKQRSPYRKGDIRFPIKPNHDVPLNIDVEMRPASGLAKVKILPQDNKILDGRCLTFDYSCMEEVSTLPELPRAWPEIVPIVCASDSSMFRSTTFSIFLSESPNSDNYTQLLDEVKNALCQPVMEWEGSRAVWRKKIDQNGQAGSKEAQNVVDALSVKLGNDFRSLKNCKRSVAIQEIIVKRGTWLWAKTPSTVIDYLVVYLSKTQSYTDPWRYYIEAASRCFTRVDQYEVLFKAIYRRMTSPLQNVMDFPIQSARSLWRILIYRASGQNGLNHKMAVAFINKAVSRIENQLSKRNFKQTFFQAILLFFVLLRYRKLDTQFMSPDNNMYKLLFKKIEDCLTKAQTMCARYDVQRSKRVNDLLNGIKDYMYYKGAPGLIQQLREEAGDKD